MPGIHLAVDCRTNVPKQSIRKDFLSKFTDFLATKFNTEAKNIQVEIQTDILMMRAGSSSPMMNMNFYHNSDKVDQKSKTSCAAIIAEFMGEELKLPVDRVLVLFFDTRKCT
ncbi:MIF-like protein mif-2 [Mytilus galloprovincialis]|uniref:L-dopachrome isomerase n=1 Tax=Mytilus galloprovincialis TaxID=29158 RepID=A0A451FY67_MYTGA|nr:macrophage migration inhibitory factor-like protein [Mytilus galloprovincialis]VDH93789.1 phenylpyruvate tautomerase [Mytilus galloprovincialis]